MPTHQLLFGFSMWGMIGLHERQEDGVRLLPGAGFSIVEADVPTWGRPEFRSLCSEHRLRPVIQIHPMTIEDGIAGLRVAHEVDALFVNAHAGTPHLHENEACCLINGLYDEAEKAGVRLLFETHRGRLTQDLYRTSKLCALVPRLRFTVDVSHFILSEERNGPTEDIKELMIPIMDRTMMIHGRISNGEQIQVEVGDGNGVLAQQYIRFWAETMRRWRLNARPGSALVFTPELGPPAYAMTDAAGKEFSDRWEQSLVLKRIGEQAWKMAVSASGVIW